VPCLRAHVSWAREEAGESAGGGKDADGFFEIENAFERDVEEVAAAAGGIEDADFRELVGESVEQVGELFTGFGLRGFLLGFRGCLSLRG